MKNNDLIKKIKDRAILAIISFAFFYFVAGYYLPFIKSLIPDFILNYFPTFKYISIWELSKVSDYAAFVHLFGFVLISVILIRHIFDDPELASKYSRADIKTKWRNLFFIIIIFLILSVHSLYREIPKKLYPAFKQEVVKTEKALEYYRTLDKYKPVSVRDYIIVKGINKEELEKEMEQQEAEKAKKVLTELKKIYEQKS